MLRLTAVGVNGVGPQPMWERQPDGQLLNHQRMAAAIWSRGMAGWPSP